MRPKREIAYIMSCLTAPSVLASILARLGAERSLLGIGVEAMLYATSLTIMPSYLARCERRWERERALNRGGRLLGYYYEFETRTDVVTFSLNLTGTPAGRRRRRLLP